MNHVYPLRNLYTQHNKAQQTHVLIYWIWCTSTKAWWRHEMETFSALIAFCMGNSPAISEFPADVFSDPRLNQKKIKQWPRRWFEMPSRSLWRHCNGKWCMFQAPSVPEGHTMVVWFSKAYQILIIPLNKSCFEHSARLFAIPPRTQSASGELCLFRMIKHPLAWLIAQRFYVNIDKVDSIRECPLTHCGVLTPYGDIDLDQHCLRKWLVV